MLDLWVMSLDLFIVIKIS